MVAADLLFRRAEVGGAPPVDVLIRDGVVAALGRALDVGAVDREIDCAGDALLPGLHDHHIHLLAGAAARGSVDCGVPRFRAALRAAPVGADGWIRGVGCDDDNLDRAALDAVRTDVPVRVQHRGGALWVVNSAGVDALGLDAVHLEGVERDGAGRPTGRLWRLDDWLGARIGRREPDLAGYGRMLAAVGVTGVTDATPTLDVTAVTLLRAAVPQRLTLLGDPGGRAPWKLVPADHTAPDPDALAADIAAVRPRPVAVHCVTRVALVVAIAAFEAVGVVPGDRIEHAAVGPPELADRVARLGLTVVTQPSLVAVRGDGYLDRVEPADAPALWPLRSLLAAGVRVGCSSDAPYGDPDPWRSIQTARDRRAPSGRVVAGDEAVPTATALDGFLTGPDDPGGRPRRVAVGAPADLIRLDRPLAAALRAPAEVRVRTTLIGGAVVHDD